MAQCADFGGMSREPKFKLIEWLSSEKFNWRKGR